MEFNLKINDIIFHEDLNKLILCRDEHFNLVYDHEDFKKHQSSKIKRFTVDNSGHLYTTNFKAHNNYKKFKVLKLYSAGGGYGHGPNDYFPDCINVECCPIEDENYIIHFHANTNCYAHSLNNIKVIYNDK